MQREQLSRPDYLSDHRVDFAGRYKVGSFSHFRLGRIPRSDQVDLTEDEVSILNRYGTVDEGGERHKSPPGPERVY